MSLFKTLIVASAISIPSMANACDLHGGFGGMHFGNLSLLNAQSVPDYPSARPSADHRSNQGVRYVRFGSNSSVDDYEDESNSSSDAAEDPYQPDGPAVLR